MKKYIVKLADRKHVPDDPNLSAVPLKLGSFHHYRNIEDSQRQDVQEGQSGAHVLVRRPSPRLDLLALEVPYIPNGRDRVDDEGKFDFKHNLVLHDHLADFNVWIYSLSAVASLAEVDSLKELFGTDSAFFITDINAFERALVNALQLDLKLSPLNEDGRKRLLVPGTQSVGLGSTKGLVTYRDDSKWMRFEVDTLEEFFDDDAEVVEEDEKMFDIDSFVLIGGASSPEMSQFFIEQIRGFS